MVQRKETPAARAALAKRRQRVAQNMNVKSAEATPSISTGDNARSRLIDKSSNDDDNNTKTSAVPLSKKETAPAFSARWKKHLSSGRPSTILTQAVDSQDDGDGEMKGEGSDHLQIKNADESGGHTVTGQTIDGTIATAALTMSTMGHNKPSPDELLQSSGYNMDRRHNKTAQSSEFLNADLNKSKSFGTATEESTFGEANIETVLRKDRSGFEYVQEVEVRPHRRRHHRPEESKAEEVRERYEPISNFGFVEVTSPQPRTGHERRDDPMQSYFPQPNSPSATQSRQPMNLKEQKRQQRAHQFSGGNRPFQSVQQKHRPASRDSGTMATASSTRKHQISTHLSENPSSFRHAISRKPKAKDHPQSNATIGIETQHETQEESYDKPSVVAGGPDVVNGHSPSDSMPKNERDNAITVARKTLEQSFSPDDGPKDLAQKEIPSMKTISSVASSATSVDRLTVSTSGGSFVRKSRIPSPAPINPDGKRSLPLRSASSTMKKLNIRKQASPKRFNLPPSGRNASPPNKQQLLQTDTRTPTGSVAASVDSSKSPETNEHILRGGSLKSASVQSFMAKRKNKSGSTNPITASSFSQPDQSPPSGAKKSEQDGERRYSSNQSPQVDRLSASLDDTMNLGEASALSGSRTQQEADDILDPVLQSRADVDSYAERSSIVKTTRTPQQQERGLEEDDVARRQNASPHQRFRAAVKENEQEQHSEHDRRPNLDNQYHERKRQSPQLSNADYKDRHSPNVKSPNYLLEFPKHPTLNETNMGSSQTPRPNSSKTRSQLRASDVHQEEKVLVEKHDHSTDAASICSGNIVLLRSCLSCTTIQATQGDILASMQGLGFGSTCEYLEIQRLRPDGVAASAHIRYGDTIVLRSSTGNRNVFGTRKRRSNITGGDELGFFDTGTIKSDHWVILPAKHDKEIAIGRAALKSSPSQLVDLDNSCGLVQNGAPIILRNCYNGGILSLRDGKLTLLTDSFDPNRTVDPDNSTLLGLLQNHDKLLPSISEAFELLLPYGPPCPSWSHPIGIGERCVSTITHSNQLGRSFSDAEASQTTQQVSPQMKERILIDEVIGSFLGVEGLHIRLTNRNANKGEQRVFYLVDSGGIVFDLSLRHLVEQILPLSSYNLFVKAFVASHCPGYEYGRILQALCAGLDSYLRQFSSFVSGLDRKLRKASEKKALTMKSIHYEVTPLLHSMSVLKNVVEAVSETKGGSLINSLWSLEQKVYMGDTVAKDLIGTLLNQCSIPYVDMLTDWLQSGTLRDPHHEFMVETTFPKTSSDIDGDSWSSLFQVSERNVIKAIFRNEKIIWKVLCSGKYWHAMQACNIDMKSVQQALPELVSFRLQSDSSSVSAYVDNAYQCSSKNLISLLKGKYKLMNSLRTMKRYFLLDQGDFFSNFLEISEVELMKPIEYISSGRVQHSLSTSIQLTEAQRDGDFDSYSFSPQEEDERQLDPQSLKCRFTGESLVAYLDSLYGGLGDLAPETPSRQTYGASNGGSTGFDLFAIDFSHVPFPTSLVLSPHAMESYKLLFRQLFFSKHVERRLVGVWSQHQLLKKLDSLRGLLGPSFLLRQRMLHFVQNLNSYMTFEVIESNWIEMYSAIDGSESPFPPQQEQTLDDILEIHGAFLGKTLDACLLTNPLLIKSLSKLLNTCLLFADQMQRFMDSTKICDDSVSIAVEKRVTVQRTLNERGKKTKDRTGLRRALDSAKEERAMLYHRQTRRVGREVCSDSYKRMVRRFEEVFGADLALFMMQLNAHTASGMVANLGLRLDWNGFVTSNMTDR